MRTRRSIALAGLGLAVLVSGCKLFDDPTPHDITVHLTGTADVEIVLSKQFVAGVDELGTTHVQVFQSDTLYRTLPMDTIVDVEVDRRLFVQVTPQGVEQTTMGTRIDVNERNVLNDSGDIFASNPWRYVYLFNQQVTQIVDVVF